MDFQQTFEIVHQISIDKTIDIMVKKYYDSMIEFTVKKNDNIETYQENINKITEMKNDLEKKLIVLFKKELHDETKIPNKDINPDTFSIEKEYEKMNSRDNSDVCSDKKNLKEALKLLKEFIDKKQKIKEEWITIKNIKFKTIYRKDKFPVFIRRLSSFEVNRIIIALKQNGTYKEIFVEKNEKELVMKYSSIYNSFADTKNYLDQDSINEFLKNCNIYLY